MNNYLIVDISNIVHMCRNRNGDTDDETSISLTIHVTLQMVKKYYNKLSPSHLILAIDKPNWRKDYTKSKDCISGKIYKGDRKQTLTESEIEGLNDFQNILRDHTGIITFSAYGCEADDFIGRFCQNYGNDNLITILSSDKDYVQCLTHPNIKLMNPLQEKYRTLENYDHDVIWHKFLKFIRAGEDGIQSAYPRVRETRLKKAYLDNFEMTNLLNETWTNKDGITFRVGDLYKENCLLMDLTLQPDYIKDLMDETISNALSNPGKYSSFHFIKFCGKYNLKNTVKYLEYLQPMLSNSKNTSNTAVKQTKNFQELYS